MPDSPSAWLRSLAAEATPGGPWEYVYEPDDSYGNEIVMVKDERGAQIQCAEWCYRPEVEKAIARLIALAPDLAVLCADAIDALEKILAPKTGPTGFLSRQYGGDGLPEEIARDMLARFAALQPKEPS